MILLSVITSTAKPCLDKLKTDADVDVVYFAEEALASI